MYTILCAGSTTCELLGVARVPICDTTSVAATKLSILTMMSTFGLEDKDMVLLSSAFYYNLGYY